MGSDDGILKPHEAEARLKKPGVDTMLRGLQKAFEKVQLIVVRKPENALQVPSLAAFPLGDFLMVAERQSW